MSEDSSSNSLKILNWAEEDRPREKLMLKGKAALSEAELIGILIGSGTKELTAVDLAKSILKSVNNNLSQLARLSAKDLQKFKGIGEAKAISIVSALELGRRRKDQEPQKKPKISSSADVYELMQQEMLDQPHEMFWALLLNRANHVMHKVQISSGGVSGTVADPKLIFNKALEALASSVILVHNHPSGNLKPSKADVELTRKIQDGGKFLEIPVLDHVIFTDNGYFSFADEGLL